MTKLRSRRPYTCRAPREPGSAALCLAVLAEADGDTCGPCASRLADVAARFNAPIHARRADWLSEFKAARIWPE